MNNYSTVNGTGEFRTTGTVSLYAGGSFNPPLHVLARTTTAYGALNGAVSVDSGATLRVAAGSYLYANSDVAVNGTLSGGNASSSLYFYGTTFTNNGNTVTLANVYFYGDSQTLQGTGSFIGNTVTIPYGAQLRLGSDHRMSRVVIGSGQTSSALRPTIIFLRPRRPTHRRPTIGPSICP